MAEGRKRLIVYSLAGILLAVAISSSLYVFVYPQVANITIAEDTVHQGDIILIDDQTLTIKGATLVNNGSIIVRDRARLIVQDATLKLNETTVSLGGYLVGYGFRVVLSDSARLEVRNSTVNSTTPQHFRILLEDEATALVENSTVYEMLGFSGHSSGLIAHTWMNLLYVYGNSHVLIHDSITPQSFFRVSESAVLSISNSTAIQSCRLEIVEFSGTIYLDQLTPIRISLDVRDSAFKIAGNIQFENSTYDSDEPRVPYIPEDLKAHVPENIQSFEIPLGSFPRISHWTNSHVARTFDIVTLYPNETRAANAKLELLNEDATLLWTGFTDDKGAAQLQMVFADLNCTSTYILKAEAGAAIAEENVTALASTPIRVWFAT